MVDISIIIVSWNAKDFLRQCLESIQSRVTGMTVETIVVDNESADGSPEMVRSDFPWVTLIDAGGNLGFGKANNLGVKHSRGRYVFLVNSDIKFLDDNTLEMMRYMDAHPDVGIVGPKVLNSDNTLQRSFWSFPTPWKLFSRSISLDNMLPNLPLFNSTEMTYFHGDHIKHVDVLSGAVLLIRREVYAHIDGFDERYFMYSEDVDLCKKCHLAGWEIVFYPDSAVIHYGGGSSKRTPVRFYIEQQRAKVQYIKKHHHGMEQSLMLMMLFAYNMFRMVGWFGVNLFLPRYRNQGKGMIARYRGAVTWFLGMNKAYAEAE